MENLIFQPMLKPSKQIIIDFIIDGLKNGKDRGKLLAIIGKKWQISQRTFDRHWKTANEQHAIKQQVIKKELDILDMSAAIEARKKAIMSADDRKEYLTKIILGEIEVPYSEAKWDKSTDKFVKIPFVELAGHAARINAIAELNKMEGEYAPNKLEITGKDGVQLFKFGYGDDTESDN